MADLDLTPAPDYSAPDFNLTETPAPVAGVSAPAPPPASEPVPTPSPEPAPAPSAPAPDPTPEPAPQPAPKPAPKPKPVTVEEPAEPPQHAALAHGPEVPPSFASAPGESRSQGEAPLVPPLEPHKNYMVWAVLITLFCCQIGGLLAIFQSSRSNSLYTRAFYKKDNPIEREQLYQESVARNRSARTWIWASIIIGFIAYFAVIVAALNE